MSKDQKCEFSKLSPKDMPEYINKLISEGRYIKSIIKSQIGFLILHEEIEGIEIEEGESEDGKN